MFESKTVMFAYAVSPVHMGAGTAIGAIDNPIQRERHTEHPMLAGSGLKGAMRDVWRSDAPPVDVVFGPEAGENASEYAGALSVADAQLVLFPVRSLRESYVYATCPTALARLERLLAIVEVNQKRAEIEPVDDDTALVVPEGKAALVGKNAQVILETFAFRPKESPHVASWAKHIASLLPGAVGRYFQQKVERDLVVLSDTRFAYFVRNATVVEPHVRIDDATGTADDGGLFYTENVPPESLFVSLVMCSKPRKRGAHGSAEEVLKAVRAAYQNRMIQVGGDATSGRGQVLLSFLGGA